MRVQHKCIRKRKRWQIAPRPCCSKYHYIIGGSFFALRGFWFVGGLPGLACPLERCLVYIRDERVGYGGVSQQSFTALGRYRTCLPDRFLQARSHIPTTSRFPLSRRSVQESVVAPAHICVMRCSERLFLKGLQSKCTWLDPTARGLQTRRDVHVDCGVLYAGIFFHGALQG